MRVQSPSKNLSMSFLKALQSNNYLTETGREYVAEEVDSLIWEKLAAKNEGKMTKRQKKAIYLVVTEEGIERAFESFLDAQYVARSYCEATGISTRVYNTRLNSRLIAGYDQTDDRLQSVALRPITYREAC